jgi:hypothetical protein
MMEMLHRKTGTAYASRQTIAKGEGLSEKTVENALYDLRRWGHIDWERRAAPDLHPGSLLHYTLPVTRWTDADLVDAIIAQRARIRGGESPLPAGDSDSPAERGLRSPLPAGESPRPAGVESPRPAGARRRDSIGEDSKTAARAAAADHVDPKGRRAKPRTQIAPDWHPTDEQIGWVKEGWEASDTQITAQAAQFRDHHRSRGSLMADWPAAWRTWWRNGYHKIPLRPVATAAAPVTPPPDLDDRSGRLHAALERRLSPKVYGDWFLPLRVVDVKGERLTVSVTDDFARKWVEEKYRDTLIAAGTAAFGRVRWIEVIVRDSTP